DVELTVDDPIVHSAADRRLEVVRDLLRELVERRLERLERPRLERLLDGVVDLLPRLLDRFDLRNVLGEVRLPLDDRLRDESVEVRRALRVEQVKRARLQLPQHGEHGLERARDVRRVEELGEARLLDG